MIWLLKRTEQYDYDENDAVVAVAPTANQARHIAAATAWQEGAEAWLDDERSTCELVGPDWPTGALLVSHNPG